MAVSITNIPRGDEYGLEKINTNFVALKTAVEGLQNGTASFTVIKDYQTLNGTSTDKNQYPILMLNFPTFQIMTLTVWLNEVNINQPWSGKNVLSIPKSYIKHTKANIVDSMASTSVQNPFDVKFDTATGIINLYNRDKTFGGCSIKAIVVLYD